MEIVKRATSTPFLVKLWSILEENNAAMKWDADGTTFSVMSTKDVETDILPRFFRSKLFSTFQRQLSYFGFKKQSTQHGKCRWYHDLFQKDQPEKVLLIKRKVNSGNEHKKRKRMAWKLTNSSQQDGQNNQQPDSKAPPTKQPPLKKKATAAAAASPAPASVAASAAAAATALRHQFEQDEIAASAAPAAAAAAAATAAVPRTMPLETLDLDLRPLGPLDTSSNSSGEIQFTSLYGNTPTAEAAAAAAAAVARPTLSMRSNPAINRVATQSRDRPATRLSPRSERVRLAFSSMSDKKKKPAGGGGGGGGGGSSRPPTHGAESSSRPSVTPSAAVKSEKGHVKFQPRRSPRLTQQPVFDKDPLLAAMSPLTPALGGELMMDWASLAMMEEGRKEEIY
jgi:hypothetical protein